MGRRARHCGAIAVALATAVLVLGGVAHAIAPVTGEQLGLRVLCDAAPQTDATHDSDHSRAPAPASPRRHHHNSGHDHRCVICQLLRSAAMMSAAPKTPALSLSRERTPLRSAARIALAEPQRRQSPRAPPIG